MDGNGLSHLQQDTDRLIQRLMQDVATVDFSDLEEFAGADTNVMYACTRLFPKWHFEVFPLLRAKRKSRYAVLAKFLQKNGYANATEPLVRGYFAKIRTKLGLVSDDEVGVQLPSATLGQSKAPVRVSVPLTSVTPTVTPPAAHVAVSTVTAPPSVSDLQDEAYLVRHMKRLKAEKNTDGQVWTQDDETLYRATNGILDADYINKNDTDRCVEVLDAVNPVYSDIWERLRVKRAVLGLGV